MSGKLDRVTGHVVLDALKAIDGIIASAPRGPGKGVIDYVRLQHDDKTIAWAVARYGYANLQRLGIDASELPKAVIGDLAVTDGGPGSR